MLCFKTFFKVCPKIEWNKHILSLLSWQPLGQPWRIHHEQHATYCCDKKWYASFIIIISQWILVKVDDFASCTFVVAKMRFFHCKLHLNLVWLVTIVPQSVENIVNFPGIFLRKCQLLIKHYSDIHQRSSEVLPIMSNSKKFFTNVSPRIASWSN